MPDSPDREIFEAVLAGNDRAFERVYDRYQQKVRLMAWGLSRRPDWVDDLTNEAWCRAFRLRRTYNPDRPFLVWFAGILQNVYREHCRNSPLTLGDQDRPEAATDIQEQPEALVSEAELLEKLNDCVGHLSTEDQTIVRLRFFQEMPLRSVAQEVKIAESTLRDVRLPAILKALRRCLSKKGIDISEFFSAQS